MQKHDIRRACRRSPVAGALQKNCVYLLACVSLQQDAQCTRSATCRPNTASTSSPPASTVRRLSYMAPSTSAASLISPASCVGRAKCKEVGATLGLARAQEVVMRQQLDPVDTLWMCVSRRATECGSARPANAGREHVIMYPADAQ